LRGEFLRQVHPGITCSAIPGKASALAIAKKAGF
jgi:hypothetical protein